MSAGPEIVLTSTTTEAGGDRSTEGPDAAGERAASCRWPCATRRTSAWRPISARRKARSRSCAQLLLGARADWIFLAGASGSGKTHLALSLCAAAEQAGRRAAYLPLLAAAGFACARRWNRWKDTEVIALDGVDAIAGNREDEVALFDFTIARAPPAWPCCHTARAMPRWLAAGAAGPALATFRCVRVALPVLDDAGRAAVLRERAQRRGPVIVGAAIEWLLTHSGRELGALVAVLDRLDRESLAAKRRITVPFLRSVL